MTYPNPADQSTLIIWPVRLKGMPWANGFYLARVVDNGIVVGETKCTIAK